MATVGDSTSAAVGIGQLNNPDDVRRVQHLLNRNLAAGAEGHLAEDGIFGVKTQARLVDYQRDVVHLRQPDGVVSSAGPTMRALVGGHELHASAEHPRADAHTAPHYGPPAAAPQHGVDMHVAPHHETPAAALRAWFDAHAVPQHEPIAPSLQAQLDAHPILHHETQAAKDWVDKALPAAQAVRDKWHVPVSVTLAQGALESGWGTVHPSNEYFGVKGKSPDGKSVPLATHEETNGKRHGETDNFRAYGSLEQSADDYGRFLTTNKRYAEAFRHTDDAHNFIHEVAKARYGSDHNYERDITSIIERHDLTRFDKPQAGQLTDVEITKALWTSTGRTPQTSTASAQDAAKALWQGQAGLPQGAQQEASLAQTSAQSPRLRL